MSWSVSERTKAGGVLAVTFTEYVSRQELMELVKLLGHIRTRANASIVHLDVTTAERARFHQGVEYASEALRVVLEEVRKYAQ